MTNFQKSETLPAWCPGCGNFFIREAVLGALAELKLMAQETLWISGIGQAAKSPQYFDCNFFNGLHGRSLPAATGAKLANPDLKVIVESGDGCHYGEGGNHFLATIRRNPDLTILVHNNQIYGLTKGQASPTSETELRTKSQPQGVHHVPFKPLATALIHQVGFVARGFSGDPESLQKIIAEAIVYPGLALVDILMPCVSFNTINTFAWYKKRCQALPPDYNPADWARALETSLVWGEQIPCGIIYKNPEPALTLEEKIARSRKEPKAVTLINKPADRASLAALLGKNLY